MATVVIHKTFKDRYGLAKEILSFFTKLSADPTNPSLHIEPIANSADRRVRTGRINSKYRAILFELHGKGESHYVLIDVLNHDDAYELAGRATLRINPVTGVTELLQQAPATTKADIDAEIESRAQAIAAEKVAQALVEHQAETPGSILAARGITEEVLTDELGLSPTAARIVFTASTDIEAQELLEVGPAWESDAVIGLLAGLSIEEIREELQLSKATADEPEDDKLIAGMGSPAARMEFVFAPGEDELRTIIESGSFDQWRIFLHPSQEAAVRANHSGSARVLGGAGTGKTVVVVHRTNHLLEQNPSARVLLTTFTRELANSLKSQMNLLNPQFKEASTHGAPGLWIAHVDAMVQRVIDNAQRAEIAAAFKEVLGLKYTATPKPLGGEEEKVWEEAAITSGSGLAPEKLNPTFLSQEYSTVILTHGIKDERSYLRISRSGRGTPLTRAERKIIWAIVEAFHFKCMAAGRFPFPAVASIAAGILDHRGGTRFFDHVLIDEAQDFHAGHWRFLRACVAKGPNDIFLAEDSHQRIYGQRLVLSHYGIETRGRASCRLRVNYRTTAENLAYASAILDGTEWFSSDNELDNLDGYRSVRHGPNRILLQSANQAEEAVKLAEYITAWTKDEHATIGVLTTTNRRRSSIIAQLAERGIHANDRRDANTVAHSPVSVMTMHNAKGLEFTHVILLDVNDKALPQQFRIRGLAPAERKDALQQQRALLYVAASRARDQLLVSVVGTPSSLLPAEK